MSLGRCALGFFGGIATLTATSLAQAQCSKDTDCKGDRVCDGGSCVAPAPAAVAPAATPPAPGATAEPEEVPPGPAAPPSLPTSTSVTPSPPKMQRHSKGMMVGGIVMVSLTPVALAVAGFSALGKGLCGIDDLDHNRSCDGYDPVIYGSLLSALVLAGVGIPLIIIGATKEPVDSSSPSATLTPWATPTSAGVGLRLQL
jgi:hypothetical protein